jgi:hypothetical protein
MALRIVHNCSSTLHRGHRSSIAIAAALRQAHRGCRSARKHSSCGLVAGHGCQRHASRSLQAWGCCEHRFSRSRCKLACHRPVFAEMALAEVALG